MKFLPVNEYNFRVNPLKPGTMTLDMTDRSKRNSYLRVLLLWILSLLPWTVLAIAMSAVDSDDTSTDESEPTETPSED